MKMEADVVIVGTGVGGLFSALSLPRDQKIIMITKSDLESSDSFLAQGGICMLHDKDDYDSYFEDTMKAGHYENRKESVDLMIRSSREIIHDLIGYGVDFQKQEADESGNEAADNGGEKAEIQDIYAFTREGAHSRPRILFHADITGKEITSTLLDAVRKLENVTIMEYVTMTDIIEKDNVCYGVLAKDANNNEMCIKAGYTIFACGGIGGLYDHSTNYPHLTGDAIAIAIQHGIKLENVDYVQIHPTCIPVHGDYQSKLTLMSESLRNDGRVWVPKKAGDTRKASDIPMEERDYYLERKYPSFGNLVPRDVASRNAKEMCDAGHGVGEVAQSLLIGVEDIPIHRVFAVIGEVACGSVAAFGGPIGQIVEVDGGGCHLPVVKQRVVVGKVLRHQLGDALLMAGNGGIEFAAQFLIGRDYGDGLELHHGKAILVRLRHMKATAQA